MNYTIKGKITLEDYKNFIKAALLCKYIFILLICLFVVLYTPIERIIKSPSISTVIAESFPVLLLIVVYIIVYRLFLTRAYKTDGMLQEEMSLTFSDDGIHWASENGSYIYRVENFRRFIFDKKLIAIYVSNRKAVLIPRHFFESKEQEKEIETFIKEKYITAKNK